MYRNFKIILITKRALVEGFPFREMRDLTVSIKMTYKSCNWLGVRMCVQAHVCIYKSSVYIVGCSSLVFHLFDPTVVFWIKLHVCTGLLVFIKKKKANMVVRVNACSLLCFSTCPLALAPGSQMIMTMVMVKIMMRWS